MPRLRVRARATEGRANKEAERALSKLLRADVRLTTGAHSRRKTFAVELDQAATDARLREAFRE